MSETITQKMRSLLPRRSKRHRETQGTILPERAKVSRQPDNPLIPIQDVGPAWYAPPKLCSRCWSMLEPGSHIEVLEGEFDKLSSKAEVCGCDRHSKGGALRMRPNAVWRVHHQSSESFLQAILDGCEFCQEIYYDRNIPKDGIDQDQLTSYMEDVSGTCFSISKGWIEANFEQGFDIEVHIRKLSPPQRPRHIALRSCEYESNVPCDVPSRSLESTWTGSPECAEMAIYWFRECLERHQHCFPPLHPSWYPTRLLEISTSHAYLIDTETIKPKGPYATLSYCWGGETFTVLTQETMAQFEAGFLIENALPTFRDTLISVKRLGINYVWIDCFCIVQDNMDWDIESAKMLDVYSNSILNISAAFAKNPRESMFATRDPNDVKIRRVLWEPDRSTGQKLYQLHGIPSSHHPFHSGETSGLSPLQQRAWVVQERLLSPRILSFEDDQISWKCPTLGYAKECCPTEVSSEALDVWPRGQDWRSRNRPCALTTAFLDYRTFSNRREVAWELWTNTVASYTQAKLTHETDRLRAIQGVADSIALHIGDVYLDGFFLRSLLTQLCFQTEKRLPSFRPDRCASLPSWSWLAWNSKVTISRRQESPGQMLATCVSPLAFAKQLPSTLYCVGKLIPPIYFSTATSSNSFSINSNVAYSEETGRAERVDYWFPIHTESPLKGCYRKFEISREIRVYGILLQKQMNGTFRRVGNRTQQITDAFQSYTSKDAATGQARFLDAYHLAKPQLIALV